MMFNNIQTLKFMHDLYIAKIYGPGDVFLLMIICICLPSLLHSYPQKSNRG